MSNAQSTTDLADTSTVSGYTTALDGHTWIAAAPDAPLYMISAAPATGPCAGCPSGQFRIIGTYVPTGPMDIHGGPCSIHLAIAEGFRFPPGSTGQGLPGFAWVTSVSGQIFVVDGVSYVVVGSFSPFKPRQRPHVNPWFLYVVVPLVATDADTGSSDVSDVADDTTASDTTDSADDGTGPVND